MKDARRKLIEMHLEAAKKRISPQTGYVHLFYDDPCCQHQQTIPILENLSYVYGLFRSRMSDPILEAKQILEKLFHFEVNGNFPIYLHHYPICKDRCLSIHMLPVLFYLLKDFKTILGDDLASRLESLSARIIDHAEKMLGEKKLPFGAMAKLSAFKGTLLPMEPKNISEIADYLICLNMRENEPWALNEVIKIFNMFNSSLFVMDCPNGDVVQDGYLPKPSLIDLFVYSHTEKISANVLADARLLLSASIVHPFESLDYTDDQMPKQVVLYRPLAKQQISAFWKDKELVRSFAIEAKGATTQMLTDLEAFLLNIQYGSDIPIEEDNSELSIYISANDVAQLFVNGKRASTFQLNDQIEIHTQDHLIFFDISALEGKGHIFGHLSMANRPSQVRKDVFTAYDWKLSFRTISREKVFGLELKVRIVEKNYASV